MLLSIVVPVLVTVILVLLGAAISAADRAA